MASERGTACLRDAWRLIHNRFKFLMLRGTCVNLSGDLCQLKHKCSFVELYVRMGTSDYAVMRYSRFTLPFIDTSRIKRISPSDDSLTHFSPRLFTNCGAERYRPAVLSTSILKILFLNLRSLWVLHPSDSVLPFSWVTVRRPHYAVPETNFRAGWGIQTPASLRSLITSEMQSITVPSRRFQNPSSVTTIVWWHLYKFQLKPVTYILSCEF